MMICRFSGQMMKQQLISFKEAQECLGFKSPASLREYINHGLPVVVVGQSRRIDIDDLKSFIQRHKVRKTHVGKLNDEGDKDAKR